MAESKLRELSTDFAVKIIKLCETIKGHYSLVNQLERSATSIGANIREADYAHGKPDFRLSLLIRFIYKCMVLGRVDVQNKEFCSLDASLRSFVALRLRMVSYF